MKVLLLIPQNYSLKNSVRIGFIKNGFEVYDLDYTNFVHSAELKIHTQIFRLPHKQRNKWNKYFFAKINKHYLSEINKIRPDYIFIYNNQMLLPETLKTFKKTSKIIFFLGDSPYYTPTNDYNLTLLFYANLIICPDTFWIQQIKLLGIENCFFDLFHTKLSINKKVIKKENKAIEQHELLYIGISYTNSWGYKKALFLSKFADMDIRIHGNSMWYRWLEFFPELKPKFILKKNYSNEYMSQLYKHTKIYPVDANPGLLNGIHLRIFDCLEHGVLPIPEYRKDIKEVFRNTGLPIISSYNKAREITQYYLIHDQERKELVKSLKSFVRNHYNSQKTVERIMGKLK